MTKNIFLQEIQNQKELAIFFDTINSLPEPKKRSEKLDNNEKIPVILSADDNYSCFISTTGCSILYNTNSFIEFYVLSEGISDKNKELIRQSFANITSHFSLEFVECDSEKDFSSVKLRDGYYVKLNTCNRLLVPKLIPNLKRAIYLDVDLIVLDDIKKLWNEDLDGHIFGCVPLSLDRFSTIQCLRSYAGIPVEAMDYFYFNSGVMLIDYDKWREVKGSNDAIVNNIFDILNKSNVEVTPDEVILNRFAYENGGYKILPIKYNLHTNYSYEFMKKNAKVLNTYEKWTLDEFKKSVEYYNYKSILKEKDAPVIHHFFGPEKPWFTTSAEGFPIPFHKHFEDFWFYAKMTPYFTQIKRGFIEKHMYIDYTKTPEKDVHESLTAILTSFLVKSSSVHYANFIEKIISVKNNKSNTAKVLTILGIRIKFKKGVKFIEQIFSVKNEDQYKVLRILGFKIKFKRKNK